MIYLSVFLNIYMERILIRDISIFFFVVFEISVEGCEIIVRGFFVDFNFTLFFVIVFEISVEVFVDFNVKL